MNRTDRLIATILLLQSRRVVRVRDIAAHFAISTRTVYRDLAALQEAGVPLAAEAGEGYSLVAGYHLPPVMFTHAEASALFVGGEFVQHLTDESLKKHMASALLKIRAVLPEEKQDYLERLQQATAVFARPLHPLHGFRDDVLALMQEAVVKRQVLKIEYVATSNNEITCRSLEPLCLIYYSDHWHLIAYCRLRQDYRDFRADRIKNIHPTGEVFAPHRDFSPAVYFERKKQSANLQEVRVKFPPNVAPRVRYHHYHCVAEEPARDGGLIVTFLVPYLPSLADWLMTFGDDLEILHPPELRRLLLERAQKAVAHYSKPC
ncbi:MAG: YafY family transcriptional regulator [candidate division KSB1 bacterium]|nr:YafY family transcriptional regulator [candidate division KSB1 bacterium]MDZ7274978.1 YafY family transcriptional regulator [candidate division KSB1 bacterium]MDZ7286571.1 YafY family transcriptional regulator [candidate division KSB1 bacterium]MDZ7299265.1 YafY family transcriptional regulator [candidate division KSB1 bacterium]MDZ7306075.1 YafY family transcriptional regulator [candidate division KSB1 bacterium]